MPAVAESVTRLTIKVPTETAEIYETEAKRRGMSLESLLSERLTRCKAHTANQGVYLNDAQRQELNHITGGHLIATGEEAVAAVRRQAQVKMGDMEIILNQRRMTRLVSRAKAERKSPEKVAEREMLRGLDQFLGIM